MDSTNVAQQGMVAIVTGLQDAKLSVTLRDARQSGGRRGQAQNATRGVSSGVQTCDIPERSYSTTQVLRSDPYMTTYQKAYGTVRSVLPPASPTFTAGTAHAVDLNRLKQQLHELRTNLKCIGGSPPQQDIMRISDAFVDSLRKNPCTAERTSSADIIQRLLSYTQSKNSSKKTRTKKVQSLTRAVDESASLIKEPSNKNTQTYTRTSAESTLRDVSGAYGIPIRKRRVVSPPHTQKNESPKTMSYDYMRIGSFSHPDTDVCYLHDVTRYVKDTLREVCNNDDLVCSSMLDRYEAHRRTHHPVAEASTLTMEENDETAQMFQKIVLRWLEEIQETASLNSIQRKVNEKASENLARELCVICSSPGDTKKVVFIEIKEHLEDILAKKGKQMTSGEKNRLSNKLANAINRSSSVCLKLADSQEGIIWEWINDIPQLAQFITTEDRQTVNNLYKSLQILQKKSVSDDIKKVEMKKYINRWLKETMKGKMLDQNTKDKLVTKLVEGIQLSTKIAGSKAEAYKGFRNSKQSSINKISVCQYSKQASKLFLHNKTADLTDEMENSNGVKELGEKVDAKTQDKVFELLTQNKHSMDVPEKKEIIRKQIIEILINDAKIPEPGAIELTETILKNAAQQMRDSEMYDNELTLVLRKEIKNIIEEYPINEKNKGTVEEYLIDTEVQRIFGGRAEDDLEKDALNILKEKSGLTSKEALSILKQLDNNNEHFQELMDRKKNHFMSPNNFCIESKTTDILNDFFDTNINNPTPEKKKTIQTVVKETVSNIKDLLNNRKDVNNTELLRTELNKQLRKVSLSTEDSVTKLAEEVLQQIESAYLKATMRSKQLRKATAYPNAIKKYTDVDDNTEHRIYDSNERRSSQTKRYTNELEHVIENWLDNLPINHNIFEDKQYKDIIINDLAEEIIYSNKKKQLNPSRKTSDAAENDNLVRKCHTWMNSFFDNDDLNTAITYTDDLVEAIQKIIAPKIVSETTALQNEIKAWQGNLVPPIKPTVDEVSADEYIERLANSILKQKFNPDTEAKIRHEISKMLPKLYSDLNEDTLQHLETSLFSALKKKGFINNNYIFTEDPNDVMENNFTEAILKWLHQSSMYQKSSPNNKKNMELASVDLAKGIKNIISAAQLKAGAEFDKLIHDEIMVHLPNIITDSDSKNDEDFMNRTANSILIDLKGLPLSTDLTNQNETGVDLLTLAVEDWMSKLAIDRKTLQEKTRLDEAIKNLVSRLKKARSQFYPTMPQHEQAIRDEARKFLRSNIIDLRKKSDERYIEEAVTKLVKTLQTVPIEPIDTKISIKTYKSPSDTLYEYIEEWMNNLPVKGEEEKVNWIKKNLVNKLVNKIGELNMNPDIFKDRDLYQDLLQDEIDQLLTQVPGNPEMNKYLPALKKDLTFKIMDARQRMLEELAGTFYKQHLRDKISNSMPLPENLTTDEEAGFELLTDKLADAFIQLRYSSTNERETSIYKKKFSDEINFFFSVVVRRYPCARIDVDKIKTYLHCALVKVPVPRNDFMKSEVEQVRIREIINDWMEDVPLRQETATEILHRYKLAAVLAKRIHYIEMEKQHNDFIDSDLKISDEITRFINKLHIIEDQEKFIPELVQNLVDKIKRSESSRKVISSGYGQGSETRKEIICSRYPSTLNQEDQDHLRRIKERRNDYCDTVAFSPSRDSCSQTYDTNLNRVQQNPICSEKRASTLRPNVPMLDKRNNSCMTMDASTCYNQPRMVVKEYIWESPETFDNPQHNQRSIMQGIQTPNILREPPKSPFINEQPRAYQRSSMQRIQTPNSLREPLERRTSNSYCAPFSMEQTCNPYDYSSKSPIINQQPRAYEPDTKISFNCPRSSLSEPPEQIRLPTQYKTKYPFVSDQPTSPTCYWSPPEERETLCNNYRSCTANDDVLSEDDYPIAESTRYYRKPTPNCFIDIKDKSNGKRKPLRGDKRSRRLGEDEEFWNPFRKQRGRRLDLGYKYDREKDNGKCNCKDRVIICKGIGKGYFDMCQSCGMACPHPRPLTFR